MKILFISKYKWPRVGGVEKHIEAISHKLYALRYKTKTIKTKIISGEDIKQPHIKIIGLFYIWFWFLKNYRLILNSDIIHIHDVFIWYLPFRFLFFWKKVYITFHGWEGKFPIPYWNILNKKLAYYLTSGNICVGKYIEKYYGIKSDFVIYGGVEKTQKLQELKNQNKQKKENTIVWLGRLEKDTGLLEFLSWSSRLVYGYRGYRIIFVGDGNLRKECQKYGKVIKKVKDPEKYLISSEYCAPSGYLSYLEAKNMGCKIMTFAHNKLKEDYWKEIKRMKTVPGWDDVLKVYLKLWQI